ncbi:MAG: hypothetical protein EP341_05430 [Sphingomonadales bacterium]|nr:MAG: hypothetical protein EP341_05430 [Sphingomonadales bacterium]
MSENEEWSWWVGSDEERYTTECGSKEEAVRIAKEEYEGAYIVEAIKPGNIPLSGYFDAHMFMERADENAWDDHGDPEGDMPVFDAPPDLRNDLQDMVRATIDAWQLKHGIKFTSFAFAASRNHEYIPADEAEEV